MHNSEFETTVLPFKMFFVFCFFFFLHLEYILCYVRLYYIMFLELETIT